MIDIYLKLRLKRAYQAHIGTRHASIKLMSYEARISTPSILGWYPWDMKLRAQALSGVCEARAILANCKKQSPTHMNAAFEWRDLTYNFCRYVK